MGYRIIYNPEQYQKYPMAKKHERSASWILTAAIVIAAAALLIHPEIRIAIKHWLLPGDPAVTDAALNGLIENVRAGEGVTRSIAAFCQEIFNGAAA